MAALQRGALRSARHSVSLSQSFTHTAQLSLFSIVQNSSSLFFDKSRRYGETGDDDDGSTAAGTVGSSSAGAATVGGGRPPLALSALLRCWPPA
jgi:hypothetical protein